MTSGKISLPRGTHCHLKIFYFSYPTSVSVLRRLCAYIHVSDCVVTIYELPLLPNSNAGETFLHKSGTVRSADWIFLVGPPAWR